MMKRRVFMRSPRRAIIYEMIRIVNESFRSRARLRRAESPSAARRSRALLQSLGEDHSQLFQFPLRFPRLAREDAAQIPRRFVKVDRRVAIPGEGLFFGVIDLYVDIRFSRAQLISTLQHHTHSASPPP